MTLHRIARAKARTDFTVELEWTDGTRSTIDFKRHLARGGVLAKLGDPVIFVNRLFVHADGESIGWEVMGTFVDFEADNLWRDSHATNEAA